MKNNIGIKSYIRLDQAMIDLFLPAKPVGYYADGHWQHWVFYNHDVNEEIKVWLDAHPESWTHIRLLGVGNECVPDPKGAYVAIGISLSEITPKQIRTLLDSRSPFSLVSVSLDMPGYTPTKNPNIYTREDKDFLYVARGIGLEQELPLDLSTVGDVPSDHLFDLRAKEQEFKDSLDGHDFWYDYSDSASVWKAGEARTKDLKQAGMDMGLSRATVDRLYLEKYNELMKR